LRTLGSFVGAEVLRIIVISFSIGYRAGRLAAGELELVSPCSAIGMIKLDDDWLWLSNTVTAKTVTAIERPIMVAGLLLPGFAILPSPRLLSDDLTVRMFPGSHLTNSGQCEGNCGDNAAQRLAT
jgi:hypothetical protein